jgi:hypothetical protein
MVDKREFPDYYVSAADSASNRTVGRLLDQFKARFIVHQLMEGVPFSELRTTIELKDIGLFFEGLGYWAPQKIVQSYEDGIVVFSVKADIMDQLIASGVVDSRVLFHLKKMGEEADRFVQITNDLVRDFTIEYRKELAKYPDLFPSLFADSSSRGRWTEGDGP